MADTGARAMKDTGLAAVFSLIIPGVGQFYNGDFLRGDRARHWNQRHSAA